MTSGDGKGDAATAPAAVPLERATAESDRFEVARFLVEAGIVADADALHLHELSGGVSFLVVAVEAPEGHFVVKRSLPNLKVAVDWPAKLERVFTEVASMRLVAQWTPTHVPPVRAVDRGRYMYAMDHAPPGWRSWKDQLMSGQVDPVVAATLGAILGTWHERTWGDATVAVEFADHEAFDQLRLDPFYRYAAEQRPDLAERLLWYLDAQTGRRSCLVHGDYSPKNVLVGDDGLWVLDYEVSHFGDPVFDLAFMLGHLALKTVHLPAAAGAIGASANAFLDAYEESLGRPVELDYLSGQIGCLMLARVHGKSPAGYLDEADRATASRVGATLLADPTQSLDALWQRLSS